MARFFIFEKGYLSQDICQREQIHEIEEDHFIVSVVGQVTSDTCTAKGTFNSVVEVNGEEATDIQQVLSVETNGVVPESESPGHSWVDCGAVPGFGVEPFCERSSWVDCLASPVCTLDSGQFDNDLNSPLSSRFKADPIKPADKSFDRDLEKTEFMESSDEHLQTSQKHGAICFESTLRQINGCPGIFISGSVQGVEVQWTTDTGATRSIISRQVFEKMPFKSRPKLEKSNCLTGVNGEPLKELGKAIFEIQLGQATFSGEIIVAEIEDDCDVDGLMFDRPQRSSLYQDKNYESFQNRCQYLTR